jgi:hypothetical protein
MTVQSTLTTARTTSEATPISFILHHLFLPTAHHSVRGRCPGGLSLCQGIYQDPWVPDGVCTDPSTVRSIHADRSLTTP